jgi:hypothetical protein
MAYSPARTGQPLVDRNLDLIAQAINSMAAQVQALALGCFAYAKYAGGLSVSAATVTIIPYNTVVYDTDGGFKGSVIGRFTCPMGKPGYYHVAAGTSVQVASGELLFSLYVNGAEQLRTMRVSAGSGGFTEVSASGDVYLLGGQYVDARVYVSAGGTLESSATAQHWMTVHKIPSVT